MNRVSVFCPRCGGYDYLQERGIGCYDTSCCGFSFRDKDDLLVVNQKGLIKVLKEGSWRVGGKSFMTPKEHP
jgi:hypothetical protein